MNLIGVAIFVLTYALISARRLSWLGIDRPAGALLGAVCFVVFGVLSPNEAVASVDGAVILLLFGVMGMGAFIGLEESSHLLENRISAFAKSPSGLIALIVWASGILSAFITNDAVCVLFAPIVVRLIQVHKLPPLPFLLALATAANTGSAATLVGNPQNMLCASLGQLSYRDHLLTVGPIALVCLGINHGLLLLMFRKKLFGKSFSKTNFETSGFPGRSFVTLFIIALTAAAYTMGANLPWTAAAGFVTLMLVHRKESKQLWRRIDWSLLLFFAGLFVVVEGFVKSGAPERLFAAFPLQPKLSSDAQWWRLSGIFLVGSNIVSNVPFILVIKQQMAFLSNPTKAWELLTLASTFAGNLTLLGSVANIIVAENARDIGGIGFVEYLKFGFPLAVITTGFGTAALHILL
jgi:Na+/H+ antiporter NhaD/arsenite permease-like protein